MIAIIRRRLTRREFLILESGQLSYHPIMSPILANTGSGIIAAYLSSIACTKRDLLVYSPQIEVIKSLLN